jgi:hypothetical protein
VDNFCLSGWQNSIWKSVLARPEPDSCCRISDYLAGRTLSGRQHWQRPEPGSWRRISDYLADRPLSGRQPWQRPEPDAAEFLITWLTELYLEDSPGRNQNQMLQNF